MRNFLHKSYAWLIMLVAMFAISGSAWAETKTFNMMYTTPGTHTDSPITINFQGWNASNGYGAYGNGTGSTITVSCTDGYTVTNITLTNGGSQFSSFGSNNFTASSANSFTINSNQAVWTGETQSVVFTQNTNNNTIVGSVVVTYESVGGGSVDPNPGTGGGGEAGGDTPATLNSTLNFTSTAWNLSINGENAVPASGCHFDTRDVFSNADGVTMTLTNVAARGEGGLDSERKGTGYAQNWPNECFYSQYSTGYFAMYFCNGEGFTINAPSGYNLSNIIVNRANTSYSMTSLIIDGVQNTDGTKGTWTGEAESVAFSTISGDNTKRILVSDIQVTLKPIVEEGEITYTINLVNAPTDAYVTLDGKTFSNTTNSYPIEKTLGKNDLEAYEPEGYYAEVEYTRDNHTYTVTYKAYNYYDVTVTGTTDPAAGVVYNEQTYVNGSRIETKDVLTESSVEAAAVTGLEAEVNLVGQTFTVNYTKLAYIEFALPKEVNDTKDGVSISISASGMTTFKPGSGLDLYGTSWNFTVKSSTFYINKIELFEGEGTTMTYLTSDPTGCVINGAQATWTSSSNVQAVKFLGKAGWNDDYYINKVRVYLNYPDPIDYTIDLEGAPAGASVRVNDDQDFDADGTYTTTDELTTSNISVTCPDTHYYNVAYNEGSHTFTVTFTAYNVYAVTVNGPAEGGVVYGGNDCTTEVKSKDVLTVDDVQPIDVAGYEAEVTFDGTTFTVTYTALPTLAIGSSATDREGNYWTSFCFNKPVEFGAGVTPCIVIGANNGKLTVEEIVAEDNEYTVDIDFTTGAYSGSSLTAMGGKLDVQGVNWNFDKGHGYAETEGDFDTWTTITFTLADDFNGFIKNIRFLTPYADGAWFEYTGGSMGYWEVIPVNGKTMELGAWHEVDMNHFYLDIVEYGDAPVFPANTAVLLKSDAPGAVTYYTRPAGSVDVSANILRASGETGFSVSNDADHLYYKLTLNAAGEAGTAAFYWDKNSNEGHSITVPAHKAYLMLPASAGSNRAAYHFSGDETLTGIEALETEADNAPVYNLQGQRVNATKAGVYVKNGKKFIVK